MPPSMSYNMADVMADFTAARERFLSSMNALAKDVSALEPSVEASLASTADVDEKITVLQHFINHDTHLQNTLQELQKNVDTLTSQNASLEENVATIEQQKDKLHNQNLKNKKRRITLENTSSELKKLLDKMKADSYRAKHLLYTIEQTSSVTNKSICKSNETDALDPFVPRNAEWHIMVAKNSYFVCVHF